MEGDINVRTEKERKKGFLEGGEYVTFLEGKFCRKTINKAGNRWTGEKVF